MTGIGERELDAAQRDNGPVARRGRYKIFLGMAAGVGKTYRMLQEGRARAEEGVDVVIGYLEPHGRAETVAQAEGLEVVPRRRVTYRETTLEEMDLPGILQRAPELCLVDELAHTNAPGVEHEKRYQDIEDILNAGIDVFSTVNVQHLESLNDRVAELTGVHVRETFPDTVLSSADEVVLIDLTPEALIQRLREGRVYPPERVETALTSFFKIENLQALREVALRQVAEDVEAKRSVVPEMVGTREDRVAEVVPQAVGERLLALVTPRPQSQRLVRRAWRSAQRLQAELDLLYVPAANGEPPEDEGEQLRALRKLASVLGAHMLIEPGDDLPDVVERVARRRGTTYILMGRPSPRRGFARFNEPLVLRLIKRLPGVDIRIVADRAQLPKDEPR
jgi:two-component system, OmpR family, sensor histidine kinase KdpD